MTGEPQYKSPPARGSPSMNLQCRWVNPMIDTGPALAGRLAIPGTARTGAGAGLALRGTGSALAVTGEAVALSRPGNGAMLRRNPDRHQTPMIEFLVTPSFVAAAPAVCVGNSKMIAALRSM